MPPPPTMAVEAGAAAREGVEAVGAAAVEAAAVAEGAAVVEGAEGAGGERRAFSRMVPDALSVPFSSAR